MKCKLIISFCLRIKHANLLLKSFWFFLSMVIQVKRTNLFNNAFIWFTKTKEFVKFININIFCRKKRLLCQFWLTHTSPWFLNLLNYHLTFQLKFNPLKIPLEKMPKYQWNHLIMFGLKDLWKLYHGDKEITHSLNFSRNSFQSSMPDSATLWVGIAGSWTTGDVKGLGKNCRGYCAEI